MIPPRRTFVDALVESRLVLVVLAATLLVSSLLTVFFVVAGLDTNREILDEVRAGQERSSTRTEDALKRLFDEMRRQHNEQLLIARSEDGQTIVVVIRDDQDAPEPLPSGPRPSPEPTRTIGPAPSPRPSPSPSPCLPVLCE